MENWLNINQFREYQWNLNSNKAKLCAYYSQEHKWVRTRIFDPLGDYLCIAITKLIKELPTIGKIKSTFSRELKELVGLGIFEKIVDDDNKKIVYYRMNPFYRLAWVDNKVCLLSQIEDRFLTVCSLLNISVHKSEQYKQNSNSIHKFNFGVHKSERGVHKSERGVHKSERGVHKSEPININSNQRNNNQRNNNHLKDGEADFLKKEFDKIIGIYPYTTNNTAQSLAFAFDAYLKLKPTQRVDLHKAIKNYSKTSQVKTNANKKLYKYIKGLQIFITNDYTSFIYGLPENFEYAQEFEAKKSPNGGENFAVENPNEIFISTESGAVNIKPLVEKVGVAKKIFANGGNLEEVFEGSEIEALNSIGGATVLADFTEVQIAETLYDVMGG